MDWTVAINLDPDVTTRVLDVLRRMRPHQLEGGSKVRIGRFNDGGYVMQDDFETVEAAYSLGISDDVSWDMDIARLGIPVFQYDHTISGLPEQHPLFSWEPICISGIADRDGVATLEQLIKKNGHEASRDLILKCDIELAEWLLLEHTPSKILRQFRQIVIEMHEFSFLVDRHHGNNVRRAIMNLMNSHYMVHVHANNFAPFMTLGGVSVPNVLELTLLRKDVGRFSPSNETFPTPLDMPCNSTAADLYLGRFTFD